MVSPATRGRNLKWRPSGQRRLPTRDVVPGFIAFTALQSELGLKLEQKKGIVDRVVIDHCERDPTEN
jgi:uncharacterized protein (TIGR03435 family)